MKSKKIYNWKVSILPNNQPSIDLGDYQAATKKEAIRLAAKSNDIKVDDNFTAERVKKNNSRPLCSIHECDAAIPLISQPKPKRKMFRASFDWNETYDAPMRFIEIIKALGFIVYDIAPEGVTFFDYVISDQPVNKYKGKEI